MTISLIWPLFIAFFVLALISPFLPLFLMWRSVALSVLALVSFRLLRGPVHWTDQDAGYSIGIALITWFLSIVFLALALRLCIAAYYDRLRSEIMLGENTRWIDRALLAVTGAVVGLALTISMASLLGGSSGGRILDLGIGLTASAVMIFMLIRRASGLAIPVTVLSIVVATISFVGSGQTRRIIEEAETLADGRPWCLVVPKWRYQEPVVSDLGFFSLPKGSLIPHLVLFVRDGAKETKAHWSIRQQRFVNGAIAIDATCNPTADTRR